jgi:hypothetical protein
MSDFSLIALIRKVIDETDLASPADLAVKVAEMVPPKHVRAALAEALPNLVQTELGRQRMARTETSRRTANPSSKVRAIREYADAWRKRLRDHISIGRDDWKLLADCSAADFRHAAESRRALAAGALANAAEFETFADACEAHKVARFADLPEKVQAELLGGAEKAA